MGENNWKQRKLPEGLSEDLISEIAEVCDISPIAAAVMVRRGCTSPEEGMAYLEPQFEDLHDPFQLPDMDRAIKRLLLAREKNEMICVYGDYDADGTTATAILLKYFNHIGIQAFFRIPNRLTEGYGMNTAAMEAVIDQGANLILTVDNGISSATEVAFCNAKGIDVIITDHHECQEILPPALAVIDAKRPDSAYPFPELCGAGIAFKLIQALNQALGHQGDLDEFLECAALATVADIVPLKDENRTIVSLGIQSMNEGAINPGIRALIEVSEVQQLSAGNIGFVLAPKINAAGRLGNAAQVVDLYLSADVNQALPIARQLKGENEKRQAIEQEILRSAILTVENERLWRNDFLIVAGQNWHSGVIGIVASKLQERWFHPVIVIGIEEDGTAKGSCRSVPGVDIFQALSSCKDLFDSFGGHEQAAGFSIQAEKIPALKAALATWGGVQNVSEKCIKTLYYDLEIHTDEIDEILYEGLERMEPCGVGNPGPVFKLPVQTADHLKTIGKEHQHLSFMVDGLRCVGFNLSEKLPILSNGNCETLCRIRGNTFRDVFSIQPNIIDIKNHPLDCNRQCWEWIAQLKKSDSLTDELRSAAFLQYPISELIPDHEKMVQLYRYFSTDQVKAVSFDQLRKNIGQINSFQLLITLNAFSELHFLTFQIKKGVVYGKKCKNTEKNSIQNAPIVVKLNQYQVMLKEGQKHGS